MNPLRITVSYNGEEKTVPLAVRPSIELADWEVENALASLQKLLRSSFRLLPEETFHLYEAEENRTMTQESFREPGYCHRFPSHWYLRHGKQETEELPSLEEMMEHTKYYSYTVRGPGSVGCTIRHFSISQMGVVKYPDLLSSERRSSVVSYDSQDKLSTTFISFVEPASEAERAGLPPGFVLQMIDEESILHSDVTELRQMVEQCGTEVTLLGLPKDTDDVQYMYSKYTEGPEGVISTEEGQVVTVVDIPLVLNNNRSVHASNHTHHQASIPSSLVGMMPFDDNGSPDNSLSCEPDPLIGAHPNRGSSHGDNVLIEGSLMDITRGQRSSWMFDHPYNKQSKVDKRTLDSLRESLLPLNQLDVGSSPSHAHSNQHPIGDRQGSEEDVWYDTVDGTMEQTGTMERTGTMEQTGTMERTGKFSPRSPKSRGPYKGRGHGEAEQEVMGCGTSEEGRSSRQSGGRRHPASLEELTKISKGMSNGQLSDDYPSHYTSSSHNHTPSDASQHSGKLNDSRGQLSAGQLSNNSVDDIGLGEKPATKIYGTRNGTTSDSVKPSSSSTSTSKPRKSYKLQRELLHKKSKTSISSSDLYMGGVYEEVDGRNGDQRFCKGDEPELLVNGDAPKVIKERSSNVHSHSMDEDNQDQNRSYNSSGHSRNIHSHSNSFDGTKGAAAHTSSLPMSLQFVSVTTSAPADDESTERLVTTDEGEQYREIDIGAAIAKSQGGGLSMASQDHTHNHSFDNSLSETKGRPLARYKSLEASSGASLVSRSPLSDVFGGSTKPPAYRPEVIFRGPLAIKQEVGGGGRRGQDRAWREYFSILAGNTIKFYKDKKDSYFGNMSDEPPLDVVPASVEMDPKVSTKKKHIFRLITANGTSYLLQADDASDKQKWVGFIQDLNEHGDYDVTTPTPGVRGPPSPPQKPRHLQPPSPISSMRRMSSPVNSLTTTSSKSSGFLSRIKKTLTRKQAEQDDYSSYVTFQQPLHNCPVSPENKRVPLVVEFCVNEVEKHGLKVEGIYRKPGMMAVINQMSGQMDRGHYMFENGDYGHDVHTVGSLLKKFLKELPDPLIPDSMHQLFLDCVRMRDEVIRLSTLKELVFRLPTAHYHTLRYLIRHLVTVSTHSEQNKMTLKNVALVFGPTLMRSADDHMLLNMSATYSVVDLLCSHADSLFEEELCLEEQEASTEVAAMANDEEEMLTKGGADNEIELQKDEAMTKASPQSVRRIKNNIEGGAKVTRMPAQRHSTHEATFQKVANWNGSGLANEGRNHMRASHSSLQSSGLENEAPKKRMIRHTYEDVEFNGKGDGRKKQDSRTRNWVNDHSEINWGRPSNTKERELTGSLWAGKNRDQQMHRATSREKLRPAKSSGRVVKPENSRQDEDPRDFFKSYQGSSPQLSNYHRKHSHHNSSMSSSSTSSVPQPQPYGSSSHFQHHHAPPSSTTKAAVPPSSTSSSGSSKSRRPSYLTAVSTDDMPVRESSSRQKDREDRFSVSEQVPSRYKQHASNMHAHPRDSWKMEDSKDSSRYAHPSPSHVAQQRVNKYIQQDYRQAPPTVAGRAQSLTRRRSSDTLESPIKQAQAVSLVGSRYYYQQQPPSRDTSRTHRTYSNDRPYRNRGSDEGNSPPQQILRPYQETHVPSLLHHQSRTHKTATPESHV